VTTTKDDDNDIAPSSSSPSSPSSWLSLVRRWAGGRWGAAVRLADAAAAAAGGGWWVPASFLSSPGDPRFECVGCCGCGCGCREEMCARSRNVFFGRRGRRRCSKPLSLSAHNIKMNTSTAGWLVPSPLLRNEWAAVNKCRSVTCHVSPRRMRPWEKRKKYIIEDDEDASEYLRDQGSLRSPRGDGVYLLCSPGDSSDTLG
jgi:hypothetical protein